MGRKRKQEAEISEPRAAFAAHLSRLVDAQFPPTQDTDTVTQFRDRLLACGMAKVSKPTIWAWMRGTNVPHIDDWPAVARALKLARWQDLVPPPRRK